MIYLIIAWTFLIIACCLIGTALLNVLTGSFKRVGDRAVAAVWLGVVVLSISLLATSLVLPLSPLVGAVVTVSICSLSLRSQRTRTEMVALKSLLSADLILGFFALELGVAALTTRPVTWIDTGLYHYGAIRWLSEFGAVPGIALLINQLGFTSSWFALAAPLNAEIFDSRVSVVTNGFAFLIAVLHFLISLAQSCTSKAQISDWLVVISSLITIPFVVASNQMSVILVSPSPDLPIVFLTQLVAWAILVVSNHRTPFLREVEAPILNAQTIPLILSVGAVSIKLTALPLLFISGLFYAFGRGFSLRRVLMGSAIIILLLSPKFIFQIITSGCPLYPSSFLCLDLPWSPTAEVAKMVAESTHNWRTWYASPSPSANSGFWLLWQWFKSSTLNTVMALLIVVSTLFATYIVRTLTTSRVRGQLWLLALAVSGITFMMFTAASFRFGMGYLILLPALSIAIYCRKKFCTILPAFAQKCMYYYHFSKLRKVFLALSLFLATMTLVISVNNALKYSLLLPPPLPSEQVVKKQVNDITYFSTKGLCWAAELPCAFELQENIKLRDPARGIKAGFVRKK